MSFAVTSSSQLDLMVSMDAEHSSRLSYDQIDSDIEPGESVQYPQERPHTQNDTDIDTEKYSQ